MASNSSHDDQVESEEEIHQPEPSPDTEAELKQEEKDGEETRATISIGKEAIETATSLVKTCLTQLCKFNLLNNNDNL